MSVDLTASCFKRNSFRKRSRNSESFVIALFVNTFGATPMDEFGPTRFFECTSWLVFVDAGEGSLSVKFDEAGTDEAGWSSSSPSSTPNDSLLFAASRFLFFNRGCGVLHFVGQHHVHMLAERRITLVWSIWTKDLTREFPAPSALFPRELLVAFSCSP